MESGQILLWLPDDYFSGNTAIATSLFLSSHSTYFAYLPVECFYSVCHHYHILPWALRILLLNKLLLLHVSIPLLATTLSLKCQSLIVSLPRAKDPQQRGEGSNLSVAWSLAVHAWSSSSRRITAAWDLVRNAERKPQQLDGTSHLSSCPGDLCAYRSL